MHKLIQAKRGTDQSNLVHSLFKDILKDVFKSAIVSFKNGVLCAHVQGPLLANSILEAAVCKACNRLLEEKIQTVHDCCRLLSVVQRSTTFLLTNSESSTMTSDVVKSNRPALTKETITVAKQVEKVNRLLQLLC